MVFQRPPLATDPLPSEYSLPVESALVTLGVFLVVYVVGRFVVVTALVRLLRARNRENPTLVAATEQYLEVLVLVVAVTAAVWAAGYGRFFGGSGLVVAAVTLAIGVAGQEVIGNLVSGVFLVSDPEFNVDDWIRWEGGEGAVETIRFRVTRVRTPSNEIITVPNTTLATTAVTRPYSRNRFRIVVRLGLSPDQSLDDALETLRAAVATIDALEDPEPTIHFDEIDSDGIWLNLTFWVHEPSRDDVAQARSLAVKRIREQLQADDIEFSPASEHILTGQLQVEQVDQVDPLD